MSALIFWIILLAAALITIGLVLLRHFGQLAALDVSTIQRVQEKSIKHDLVLKKIFRQVQKIGSLLLGRVAPLQRGWKKLQQVFRNRANDLADNYRQLELKHKWQEWRSRSRHERRAHLLALLEEAEELRQTEQYDAAEKKYIEIISLDPKNVSAYFGLGKNYFHTNAWPETEQAMYFITHTLDAGHELAWAFLGRAYKAEGKWSDAVEAFDQALKINPGLAKRWLDLGDCYREMGGTAEALAAYKNAAKCEPNNPRVLDQLIEIGVLSGDKRLAREAWHQLAAANPENQKLAEWKDRIEKM